uniref:Uncharacterized protein n=1 Tax=Lynx canadensis TaxID=61383 RepID=A0A667HVI6_LYNCA
MAFLLQGRKRNGRGFKDTLRRIHEARRGPVYGPATCSVVAERAVGAQEVAALHAVGHHVIKGLFLEVERIQSRRHLKKAALRHAGRAGPEARRGLVDAQLTDVVGPGDGAPLGQHHGVAAGGRRYRRRVRQLGGGLGRQRPEQWGVRSPQVLKEPLDHLVPVTVVVLQGHFGDLKHRADAFPISKKPTNFIYGIYRQC